MRWVWVDRLLQCDPGKNAVGVKCFSLSDPMFQDHFPGFPIVPGVIQIEMIAQVGGKCLRASLPESLTVLASVKSAKFYRSIEPGDRCEIHVQVESLRNQYAVVSGTIFVEDRRVATATIMYGMLPATRLEPGTTDFVLDRWKKEQAAKTTQTEVAS
jgi:3-hydroxyacyl-[acyl-carrier-protein] dehydratase